MLLLRSLRLLLLIHLLLFLFMLLTLLLLGLDLIFSFLLVLALLLLDFFLHLPAFGFLQILCLLLCLAQALLAEEAKFRDVGLGVFLFRGDDFLYKLGERLIEEIFEVYLILLVPSLQNFEAVYAQILVKVEGVWGVGVHLFLEDLAFLDEALDEGVAGDAALLLGEEVPDLVLQVH